MSRRRYGIAEWYGLPFLSLTPKKRQRLAMSARGEKEQPACPFRAMQCNKSGGVCTIQPYTERAGRIGDVAGEPVIVCPVRFDQDRTIVTWLADIVGFSPKSTKVAREIPFMRSDSTGKPAGKIDLVVAAEQHELRWFGLEIQAVYFSGPGMDAEFTKLRQDDAVRPPYPSSTRRPDWRSSGAKRLMPQLQVKGPTLRRWHSKIAVAIDWPFFTALGGPSPKPSHDLDDGDVIWLIPKLVDGRLSRGHWEVLTLESTTTKLLAAKPITRRDFEQVLRAKLRPLKEMQ